MIGTVPRRSASSREWALRYASLGWRLFPVINSGKKPVYTGWQRDATTDCDLIGRYWRREPGPNIGLICGEAFVAFDIEVDHLAALSAWMREHGRRLPETPVARTGRGGVHILVTPFGEDGHALRLDGVRIGELKAIGGFIVACPSHTRGRYEWLRSPEDVRVGEAPDWLRGLVSERAPREASAARESISPSRAMQMAAGLHRVVSEAAVGTRNEVLFWAACRASERGLELSAATEILLAAARLAGLPETEARRTIASGFER